MSKKQTIFHLSFLLFPFNCCTIGFALGWLHLGDIRINYEIILYSQLSILNYFVPL